VDPYPDVSGFGIQIPRRAKIIQKNRKNSMFFEVLDVLF
jgi:hypothetical protein